MPNHYLTHTKPYSESVSSGGAFLLVNKGNYRMDSFYGYGKSNMRSDSKLIAGGGVFKVSDAAAIKVISRKA